MLVSYHNEKAICYLPVAPEVVEGLHETAIDAPLPEGNKGAKVLDGEVCIGWLLLLLDEWCESWLSDFFEANDKRPLIFELFSK